jgi:hypothetical protein
MTFASNLLARNKRPEAENVLRPLLNHPHSPEIREAARAMLNISDPAIANMPDIKPEGKKVRLPQFK